MSLHRAALLALLLACTLSPMFSGAEAQMSCTWPFKNATLSFTYCANLTGGYMLGWNASASSITVGFSKMSDGWIAWGVSPNGMMVGSSAIIGYNDGGVAKVDSYFLGATSPEAITPPAKFAAGNPTATGMEAEYVGGYIRTLTTLPIAPATTSFTLIWADGPYISGIKRHPDVRPPTTINIAAGTVGAGTAAAPTLGTAMSPPMGNATLNPPSSAPAASRQVFASACLTALMLVFTFALV